jgi:hypothetical protein
MLSQLILKSFTFSRSFSVIKTIVAFDNLNLIFKKSLILVTCTIISIFLVDIGTTLANPIYVYRQADGTIRFSTKRPSGIQVKVFSSVNRGGGGTLTRASFPSDRTKLFHYKYDQIIRGAANRYRVDPSLVKAVIHAESSFNPGARSRKGAIGLMQLMPGTAKRFGVRQPYSVFENINGGVLYLSKLISRYRGSLIHAVAAYNAGEGAVDRYRGIPPYSETRNYVRKVLALRDLYRRF